MNVHIVSRAGCPYCDAAKQLFRQKDIAYTSREIDDFQQRQLFYDEIGLTDGNRTVPQIFIDGVRIGGYSDLLKFIEKRE